MWEKKIHGNYNYSSMDLTYTSIYALDVCFFSIHQAFSGCIWFCWYCFHCSIQMGIHFQIFEFKSLTPSLTLSRSLTLSSSLSLSPFACSSRTNEQKLTRVNGCIKNVKNCVQIFKWFGKTLSTVDITQNLSDATNEQQQDEMDDEKTSSTTTTRWTRCNYWSVRSVYYTTCTYPSVCKLRSIF